MRITPDTGILIRTNTKATGPARELLLAASGSRHRLVLSRFLLDELSRVLRYPRIQAIYKLEEVDIRDHMALLRSLADIVEPATGPPLILKDPEDDPVVYTALAGQADVICTLDRHFYEPNVVSFCSRYGIRIMGDVDLLREIRPA